MIRLTTYDDGRVHIVAPGSIVGVSQAPDHEIYMGKRAYVRVQGFDEPLAVLQTVDQIEQLMLKDAPKDLALAASFALRALETRKPGFFDVALCDAAEAALRVVLGERK